MEREAGLSTGESVSDSARSAPERQRRLVATSWRDRAQPALRALRHDLLDRLDWLDWLGERAAGQLLEPSTRHAELSADADDGQAFGAAGCFVSRCELVGGRAANAQHLRRLENRQEIR